MAVSAHPSISGIYGEANGGTTPSGPTPVSELFKLSFFEGPPPLGNSTITYNAWGQYGNTAGADRIYGLSALNSNLRFLSYSGLTYFYTQSTYSCPFTCSNTAPTPSPPNFYLNDVNVGIQLFDSTGTYVYASTSFNSPASGGGQSGGVDQPNSPIIYNGYWAVSFSTGNSDPGLKADLTINGTSKFTNLSLTSGGNTNATFSTYGAELVSQYTSGKYGLAFTISIHL